DAIAACLKAHQEGGVYDYYEKVLMGESLADNKAHVLVETPEGKFVNRYEFDTNQEAADLLTSLQGKPFNVTYKPIGMNTTGMFFNGNSQAEKDRKSTRLNSS